MSDWSKQVGTLGDFITFRNGKSSPERDKNGCIDVFGSNGVIGQSDKMNAAKNSLIIGRVGSYCGSVYFSPEECWVTDNAIVGTSKTLNDARFWYYKLLSLELNNYRTGSGQPLLNQQILNNIDISVPVRDYRIAIAHILGTLDDKIALNSQINNTLEEMAQAIFKSWFVDFEPVKAKISANEVGEDPLRAAMRAISGKTDIELERLPIKALTQLQATAALFPEELEESESGELPKGWEVRGLDNVTCYLSRGISPKYVDSGGVLVLNQKCIRDNIVDSSKARRHDPDLRKVDGRELLLGDVLVNSTGVGTLGRVAQVLDLNETTIVDSHVTVVRASESITWNYLGMELLRRQSEIEALGEGSTGQTELSRGKLAGLRLLLPPKEILSRFDSLTTPLREQLACNLRQNLFYAEIRDTLLPKLLSGELELSLPD